MIKIDKPNQFESAGVPSRHFRDALYASLLHVKPKYCLEIGTHIGQSTAVFQRYFEEHEPQGVVVTVDITKLVNIKSDNVKQILLHDVNRYPPTPLAWAADTTERQTLRLTNEHYNHQPTFSNGNSKLL